MAKISILGFGLFQKELAKHLYFQEESYEELKEGTQVLAELFVTEGDKDVEKVLKNLYVELSSLETHPIDREMINWENLEKIDDEDCDSLFELFKCGFQFMVYQHPE